eukprot:279850-Alexandrium_andersonii.AAC.1
MIVIHRARRARRALLARRGWGGQRHRADKAAGRGAPMLARRAGMAPTLRAIRWRGCWGLGGLGCARPRLAARMLDDVARALEGL